MTKSIPKNDFIKPAKPISPPFTFRDPNDPNTLFGCATTLCELYHILPFVPYYSIEYHIYRLDSENQVFSDLSSWLYYVLEEKKLAKCIKKLGFKYRGLDLKEKFISLLSEYCN